MIAQLASQALRGGVSPESLPLEAVNQALTARPSGSFWEFFVTHRAYVRWPREYLLVLEAYGDGTVSRPLTQRDFDDREAEAPAAGDEFQRAFLACRAFLVGQYYDLWIGLFDAYGDAISAAKNLAGRFETRILTGRDGPSVLAVLASSGWLVPPEWVFDARRYRNKKEGFAAIRDQLGAERCYALVDDNIEHLKVLAVHGVSAFWATWGYVTPAHEATGRTVANLIRLERTDWATVVVDELTKASCL